jgi:hypothetical protein
LEKTERKLAAKETEMKQNMEKNERKLVVKETELSKAVSGHVAKLEKTYADHSIALRKGVEQAVEAEKKVHEQTVATLTTEQARLSKTAVEQQSLHDERMRGLQEAMKDLNAQLRRCEEVERQDKIAIASARKDVEVGKDKLIFHQSAMEREMEVNNSKVAALEDAGRKSESEKVRNFEDKLTAHQKKSEKKKIEQDRIVKELKKEIKKLKLQVTEKSKELKEMTEKMEKHRVRAESIIGHRFSALQSVGYQPPVTNYEPPANQPTKQADEDSGFEDYLLELGLCSFMKCLKINFIRSFSSLFRLSANDLESIVDEDGNHLTPFQIKGLIGNLAELKELKKSLFSLLSLLCCGFRVRLCSRTRAHVSFFVGENEAGEG